MLNPVFRRLRNEARRIAEKLPEPDFYIDFADEVEASHDFFGADPVVLRLRAYVRETVGNDFGHGIDHCEKVALDAGALAGIEGATAGIKGRALLDLIRLAQVAGLLHDIRRRSRNHAREGALFAEKLLRGYPLDCRDVESICTAIYNHEAFGEHRPCTSIKDRIVSASLYDSDKFRWGPDNFTTTVWDMVEGMNLSFAAFKNHYPDGMAYIEKIKTTFRTRAGKNYGPQFIELGLYIGSALLAYIEKEFTA